MTDKSTSSFTPVPAKEVRIGETLRAAREAAAYSITYVSGEIHLSEQIIKALEADQFDQLPDAVFVKGYIRSYAKLLEIDVNELLSAFPASQEMQTKTVSPTVKKVKKIKSFGVDTVIIWSSVTVVAIVVGLLVTWWSHQEGADPVVLASVVESFDEQPQSKETSSQVTAKEKSAKQHNVVLGKIDPDNISAQQNATPEVIEEDDFLAESPFEIQQMSTVVEAQVSGGEIDKVRITVKYTEESWTEIFDAQKRRLLHGLIKPGETRVISGRAPFNVFLGNSPGVQLEINGKPFDHSIYMRRNNTARFLIDDNNS